MLLFEEKPLERLQFVIQTGGNNPQVKGSYQGCESVFFLSLIRGAIKLSAKGRVNVFGEDGEYRGYIVRSEYGVPKKYPEKDGSHFDDWYSRD